MNERSKNIWLDITLILVIIMTFVLWVQFFPQQYFLAAVLLILEILLYGMINLERMHFDAKEMGILAALAVIAVVSRVLFYAFPQVKPTAAIVIISGLALGKAPGLIVGVLSMFLSNFFFGHGTFTPFQMLGMGLVGFFVGFFRKHKIEKKLKSWHEAVIGFVLVFLVYGFIVDSSSVVFLLQSLQELAVISIYAAGIPFNLIHAASTVIFLLILSPMLTRQLSRICHKYGLFSVKMLE